MLPYIAYMDPMGYDWEFSYRPCFEEGDAFMMEFL
jgi:hypothetical protein